MIFSKKDLVITMFAVFGLIIVFGSSQSSIAAGVEIWDNDTSGWVSDSANGDPIDRGYNNDAIKPQVTIDSEGNVYIAYYQYDGSAYRVFLNRYDGNIVEIWSSSGWTTEFDQGTPIDKMGLPLVGTEPDQEETYGYPIDIAIDTNNVVYVVYRQSASVEDPDQILLSRYLVDGNEEQVQITVKDYLIIKSKTNKKITRINTLIAIKNTLNLEQADTYWDEIIWAFAKYLCKGMCIKRTEKTIIFRE